MKRILALALTLVLALSLVACGGSGDEEKYLGTWKTTSMIQDGQDVLALAESMGMSADDFSMTFEFKEGGTVALSVMGEEEEGEWTVTDTGLEITDGTEGKMVFADEDGKLVSEFEGAEITIEKQ